MAKKKIKRALKRVAKAAVPMLAIAGLGKAFMNARNQRKQMKDFLATEGGDISNMTSRPNMFDIAGPVKRMTRQVPKMTPEMLDDDGQVVQDDLLYLRDMIVEDDDEDDD